MSKQFQYTYKSNLLCDYQEDILDSDQHETFSDAVESAIEFNGSLINGSVEVIKEYLGSYGEIIGWTAAQFDAETDTLESYFCDGSKVPNKILKKVAAKITNP